jgi:hypothetical protein
LIAKSFASEAGDIMAIVTGRELLDELKNAVGKAAEVKLAIAFWGSGALKSIGLTASQRVEIICNLSMGGTNPDEIERILRSGATVYPHPTLHAKMGLAGRFGFVGSSNASANGLGLQGQEARQWEELNVIFRDTPDLDRLELEFSRLKAEAETALVNNDPRLIAARRQWISRQTNPVSGLLVGVRLIDAVRSDADRFRDIRAYVVMHVPVSGEDADALTAAEGDVQNEFGPEYSVYRNWPELPSDALLIDFIIERGKAKYGGIWRLEPSLGIGDPYTHVCRQAAPPQGLPRIDKNESKEWERLVLQYWRKTNGEPTFVDLYDFATQLT